MFLTIFTPIYNRERYVDRLFKTITQQKKKNFEWIIINDGSNDMTRQKIEMLLANNKFTFPIKFLTVQNGGKQRAINRAVTEATGKYFFILDSDDMLFPDTTIKIETWCNEIEKLSNYNQFAGVSGLRVTPDHRYLSGTGDGSKYIDCSNLNRYKNNLEGDMAEVYKTNLLRKYPFKVFKGENFVSEETVWNKIAANGFIIRWYLTPIYIGDYLSDGLTKNSNFRDNRNYKGLVYQTKEAIRLKKLKKKITAIGYFVYISRQKNISWKIMKQYVKVPKTSLQLCYLVWKIHQIVVKRS